MSLASQHTVYLRHRTASSGHPLSDAGLSGCGLVLLRSYHPVALFRAHLAHSSVPSGVELASLYSIPLLNVWNFASLNDADFPAGESLAPLSLPAGKLHLRRVECASAAAELETACVDSRLFGASCRTHLPAASRRNCDVSAGNGASDFPAGKVISGLSIVRTGSSLTMDRIHRVRPNLITVSDVRAWASPSIGSESPASDSEPTMHGDFPAGKSAVTFGPPRCCCSEASIVLKRCDDLHAVRRGLDFPAGKSLPPWNEGGVRPPTSAVGVVGMEQHATRGGCAELRSEQWAVATRLRRVTASRSHFPAGKWPLSQPFGCSRGEEPALGAFFPAGAVHAMGWLDRFQPLADLPAEEFPAAKFHARQHPRWIIDFPAGNFPAGKCLRV